MDEVSVSGVTGDVTGEKSEQSAADRVSTLSPRL